MQELSFSQLCPHVRYANLLQCPPGFREGPRRIYDHQLLYVHEGKGKMVVHGQEYPALPGDVFFYGPGVVHAFLADEEEPYLLTGLHFDFTQAFNELPFPIGSFSLEHFTENCMTETVAFTDFKTFPAHISLAGNHRVRELAISIPKEFNEARLFYQAALNGLFLELLTIIARHVALERAGIDSHNPVIEQVIRFIQLHYREPLTNERIAGEFHFHPNYLNQLITAHTGMPLRQYLIDFRIRRAIEMLVNTDKCIVEIAGETGHTDIHYFSRIFRQKTGCSPRQFRMRG